MTQGFPHKTSSLKPWRPPEMLYKVSERRIYNHDQKIYNFTCFCWHKCNFEDTVTGCVRFTILYAADRDRENRPAFVSIRELCVRNFQYARSDPMDPDRAVWPVLRSKIWHLLPWKISCWVSSTNAQTGTHKCKQLSDWFKLQLAARVKISDWLLKLAGKQSPMDAGHMTIFN